MGKEDGKEEGGGKAREARGGEQGKRKETSPRQAVEDKVRRGGEKGRNGR